MEYVNLGSSGLKVSRICLGTMTYGTSKWREWVLNEKESRPFIKRALELGINFFDTADMYAARGVSEEVTGRALRDFSRRKEVIIATKVFWPMSDDPNARGLSRKHIMDAIHASLKRLGTDYIDLYYIHRWDYDTPIQETLETLNDLVRMGMVRYLGASSTFAWQFCKSLYIADMHGWSRFVAMQNHYNLVYREEEREMNPLCLAEGIAILPWSPLARGFLTGSRRRDGSRSSVRARTDEYAEGLYDKDSDFDIQERVLHLAKRLDVTPAQIALAWMLNKPGITAPVIGATKMDHLLEAVASLEVKLSDEDTTYLEELYQPHPILGHS